MKSTNSKSIKRLIFACDQHSVSSQGFFSKDGKSNVTTKPLPTVAAMVEQFINDGLRVAFLTDSNNSNYADDEISGPITDDVEFISVSTSTINSQKLSASCKGFSAHPGEILLVAADRKLRAAALKAGMTATPHPAMVESLIDNQPLSFGKLSGEKDAIQRLPDIVPYYLETHDHETCHLLTSMSPRTIAQAIKNRIDIQIYPVDPANHDFLFVRLDKNTKTDLLSALANKTILSHEQGRILVALDAEDPNDNIVLHGTHGHYWYLTPSPELLTPVLNTPSKSESTFGAHQTSLLHSLCKSDLLEHLKPHPNILDKLDLLLPHCPMSASDFQNTVDRYSGTTALDSIGSIQSREVRHPDNERAVNALVNDLRTMGYCAWTHSFSVAGLTAKNVIAELPGRGYFRLDPALFDKIRHIFHLHQRTNPVTPWLRALEKILGKEWSTQLHAKAKTAWQLRRLAELQLGVYHFPALHCPIAGFGARLIIVGCHLDSTAAMDGQFDPTHDAAPGADDDASGIAGTLAAAKFMTQYRNKLRHSVRFCFFNAEELGMVGSQAYAAYLKSTNASVKATVCMDMIGFNNDTNRLFEVHAGYTDPMIRDQSVIIANQIASSAAQLGSLAPAQIYQGTIASSSSNRNTHDGAINRSDHASFHNQGYPAVVVSEDFFINQDDEPSLDANPNYHHSNDTIIDSSYGADIACAVAHAVKKLAE